MIHASSMAFFHRGSSVEYQRNIYILQPFLFILKMAG